MTKQEFLALCDQVFRQHGFIKKGKSYYLDLGSDIVGSVHFQYSDSGGAIYLNCGFSLKDYNECLPYPKYRDTNMSWRIAVPGKEKLANKPESYAYQTEMIKYEFYAPGELEASLNDALNAWVMPAIRNGMAHILAHDEYYRVMVKAARMFHKLPE